MIILSSSHQNIHNGVITKTIFFLLEALYPFPYIMNNLLSSSIINSHFSLNLTCFDFTDGKISHTLQEVCIMFLHRLLNYINESVKYFVDNVNSISLQCKTLTL